MLQSEAPAHPIAWPAPILRASGGVTEMSFILAPDPGRVTSNSASSSMTMVYPAGTAVSSGRFQDQPFYDFSAMHTDPAKFDAEAHAESGSWMIYLGRVPTGWPIHSMMIA